MKNKKGEIATLLTLGLVVLGAIITMGSSFFVSKTKIASNSRAAEPINCTYTSGSTCRQDCDNQTCSPCANKKGTSLYYRCPGTIDDSNLFLISPVPVATFTPIPTISGSNPGICPSDFRPGIESIHCCFLFEPGTSSNCGADEQTLLWFGNCMQCIPSSYWIRNGATSGQSCDLTSGFTCLDSSGNPVDNSSSSGGGVGDRGRYSSEDLGYDTTNCPAKANMRGAPDAVFNCCTKSGGFGGCFESPCDKQNPPLDACPDVPIPTSIPVLVASVAPGGTITPGAVGVKQCPSGAAFQQCIFGDGNTRVRGPASCGGATELRIIGCKAPPTGNCENIGTTKERCEGAAQSYPNCTWKGTKCINGSADSGAIGDVNCKDPNQYHNNTCKFYCGDKQSTYPNRTYYLPKGNNADNHVYDENCSILGTTALGQSNVDGYCSCTSVPSDAENTYANDEGSQYWNCKLGGSFQTSEQAQSQCLVCAGLFGWHLFSPDQRQCAVIKDVDNYNIYCCEGREL